MTKRPVIQSKSFISKGGSETLTPLLLGAVRDNSELSGSLGPEPGKPLGKSRRHRSASRKLGKKGRESEAGGAKKKENLSTHLGPALPEDKIIVVTRKERSTTKRSVQATQVCGGKVKCAVPPACADAYSGLQQNFI